MRIHGSGEIIWLPWRSIQIFQFLETPKNTDRGREHRSGAVHVVQQSNHPVVSPEKRMLGAGDSGRDLPGIRRLTNDAHQAGDGPNPATVSRGAISAWHIFHGRSNKNQFPKRARA